MKTFDAKTIRNIVAQTRQAVATKTAANITAPGKEAAGMADSNGEVKDGTTAKPDAPEGIAAQTPSNPAEAAPVLKVDGTLENQVGKSEPAATNGDSTTNAESLTETLRKKVAAIVNPANKTAASAEKPSTPEKPVTTSAAEAPKVAADSTVVTENDLQKIASVLATETGRRGIQNLLMEQLGAEAAGEYVKAACAYLDQHDAALQEQLAQKEAYNKFASAIAALPPVEQKKAIAMTEVFEKLAAEKDTDITQVQAGFNDAVRYIESCEQTAKTANDAAAEGAAPIPPEEAQGAMPVPEEAPATGSEDQLAELASALEELVASGQLTPEQAQEIAQMVMQELGNAGGAPAEGGAVPPEAVAAEATQKAASIVDEILK